MDDVVSESWEGAAESRDMDRQEKLRISQKQTYPGDLTKLEMPSVSFSRILSSSSGCSPLKTTAIVIQDGSLPAAPQPQIRILKRPSSNSSLCSPAGPPRPLPQVKSLAQREAEYAEARRRILGSASPDNTSQDSPNGDRPVRVNAPQLPEDSRAHSHVPQQAISPGNMQGIRQRR